LQGKPRAQSDAFVQLVLQVAPPQRYAPQDAGMPALHVPLPLQLSALLAVPPLHAAAEQVVEAPGKLHVVRTVPLH
jgi:hypothetical protein